ncbi:hypothetical protein ACHAXH_004718 [Discostella pseudostelligera]
MLLPMLLPMSIVAPVDWNDTLGPLASAVVSVSAPRRRNVPKRVRSIPDRWNGSTYRIFDFRGIISCNAPSFPRKSATFTPVSKKARVSHAGRRSIG